MKFDKTVEIFLESPDTIYALDDIDKTTFFVFERGSDLAKVFEDTVKKSQKEIEQLTSKKLQINIKKAVKDWFSKYKIPWSSGIVVYQNDGDGNIYINGKEITKNKQSSKWGTHNAIMDSLFYKFTSENKIPPPEIENIRRKGYAGRLTLDKAKDAKIETPLVSFWGPKPPQKILDILIKNTKSLKWPAEINIEYSRTRNAFDDYDNGDIEKVSTSGKKEKINTVSLDITPHSGVADKYLKNKYPGVKFENKKKIMKFDILVEKFLNAAEIPAIMRGTKLYVEIFKNPSKKELNECGYYCRGIIDKEGNLYVASAKGPGNVIHADILKLLKNDPSVPTMRNVKFSDMSNLEQLNKAPLAVGVHRYKDTFDFYLAESTHYSKDSIKYIKQLFKKAEEKNPSYKFHSKTILEKEHE